MSRRTLAAVIAMSLVAVLVILAWVLPLPYTVYRPGPTVNVLSDIKVSDASIKTYPDPGAQIRMTTVNETLYDAHLGLWSLLGAWISRDAAVYPRSVAYPQTNTTDESSQQEGAQQMTGAQQTAQEVALEKLGYSRGVRIAAVIKGQPAAGHLRKGDVVTAVGATKVTTSAQFVAAVAKLTPGTPASFTLTRGHASRTVTVTPRNDKGTAHLGVSVEDDLPFKVDLGIPSAIGGPSAGLMMTLSIYDYLTPGSLTGNQIIAGTGTIAPDGTVGAIGGIQQKIPAAKNAGAKIFLVPADNCEDVTNADHGSMRLVKVSSFDDALASVRAWVKDPSAPLPSCGGAS